jgi:hypothetical protein
MIGDPKHLNTKYDYEYVREHLDNWRHYFEELYDDRLIWDNVELTGEGITDDTHRLIQSQDMEFQEPITIQQELKLDEHCKLLRIGFTVEEVEAVLAS